MSTTKEAPTVAATKEAATVATAKKATTVAATKEAKMTDAKVFSWCFEKYGAEQSGFRWSQRFMGAVWRQDYV